MAQLGRISGPMLADDLLLNGRTLAFKDQSLSTPLLNINSSTGRIGVNTDTPATELEVIGGLKYTNLTLTDPQSYGNLTIQNGSISVVSGNLTIGAASETILPGLLTGDFLFDGNRITSLQSNANLELLANGTGTIEMIGDVNVSGNLYSSSDITIDGTAIQIGDDSTVDSVTINSEFGSSVVPRFDYVNSLGNASKRWNAAYVNRINIENLALDQNLNLPGISILLEQGNTFYVSTNGSDSYTGTRVQEPLRTLKAALQAADPSSVGPVMIHLAPGVYDEEFPLEVPANVAISGEEMRTVIIRPVSGTESNDAFLLNDTSTIENITVTGFYYDSFNDTGYAFRFKESIDIPNRSPYVRNTSVITQGSATTIDDPRGFASGDAGRGALVDGAAINSTSPYVSMLFYSVTFICPNADIITVTNGARSELINIFTYFGSKSIHILQGSGRTGLDGSTIEYGGEMRIIGSASCYGTEGVVADGADTIAYIINHNFHYIGANENIQNDPTLNVEENQAIELNGGTIHYTTIDSTGKYRIGDTFYVDFEQGVTSIAGDLSFNQVSRIRIVDGFKETIITADEITQQNLYIINTTITTINGDLNLDSQSGTVYVNDNMAITGTLTLTGDIDISGNVITLGNDPDDEIDFNVPFDQDLVPGQDRTYDLGSSSRTWNLLYSSQADFEDILIYDNVITTTQSNSNLELKSSGTGEVMLYDIGADTNTLRTRSGQNITLSSSTDVIELGGNTAFIAPSGTTVQRIDAAGDIRFNTDENLFEGYSTFHVRFGGLFSDDGETGIYAGPVTNAVYFQADNAAVGNIDDFRASFSRVEVDDTIINGNSISSGVSNANLELRARGTGVVYLGTDIGIDDESFVNETNGSFNISVTNFGRVVFDDTYGIGFPSGTTAERPSTVEVGMTRYNTDEEYLETWDGTQWIESLGGGGTVTEEEFDEIRTIWAFVLG